MLLNIKALYGRKLAATDGDIGHVKDFYFDDKTWAVRYVVVDTGTWLEGRLVLLSPHAFGHVDKDHKELPVHLNRARIEGAPSAEAHLTVTRRYEEEYYRYYGWPAYWQGEQMWGLDNFPAIAPAPLLPPAGKLAPEKPGDAHLQSTRAIAGYRIQAVDGVMGEVSDFLLDPKTWAIGSLLVEAGHLFAGKEIRIPSGRVDRISFDDSSVVVSLTKADIERTVDHGVVRATGASPGAGEARG